VDPTWLTATELAGAIRDRRISSIEAVRHSLERIDRLNGALNALVLVDGEGALRRAREADAALSRGEKWGPLHGVPVTIKDCWATAGMRTTGGGHARLLDHVPAADATAVGRLRASGAVVLGKTNLPELAADIQTWNRSFGRTGNPWDLRRTPGGSTGGGAAAVAAGLSPLELGSDLGGSIRIPAAFCGLFGLKPTELRVPLTGYLLQPPLGPKTERHMDSPGLLARSIEDLLLGLSVIAGPDGSDVDVPPVPLGPAEARPLENLRIAWFDHFGEIRPSSDTARVFSETLERIAGAGCYIERAAPEGFDFDEAFETWALLLGAFTRSTLPSDEREKLLGLMHADDPFLRDLGRGTWLDLPDLFAALDRRDQAIRRLELFFERWDAWLCPIAPGPAFTHRRWTEGLELDGRQLPYFRAGPAFTTPFNLTGSPAVALPAGLSAEGLPVGVQLVGRRWAEAALLDIAGRVTEVLDPIGPPPTYR
jgi:amidase